MFDGHAADASGVELLNGLLREVERHRLCLLCCATAKRRVRAAGGAGSAWETLRDDEYPNRRVPPLLPDDGDADGWAFLFRHRAILERYAQAAVSRFGPGTGSLASERRDGSGEYEYVEGSSLPVWSLDEVGCHVMEQSSDQLLAACGRVGRTSAAAHYRALASYACVLAHDCGAQRWYASVLVRWEYLAHLDGLIARLKAADLDAHGPAAPAGGEGNGASAAAPAARSEDPLTVFTAAEAMRAIALRMTFNAVMLKAGKPGAYDDRAAMNADARVASSEGYLLVAAARRLSLDAEPLIRFLRDDRLWEYPDEPDDLKVFEAVRQLAERVSVEARVRCSEAGIDVDAWLKEHTVGAKNADPAAGGGGDEERTGAAADDDDDDDGSGGPGDEEATPQNVVSVEMSDEQSLAAGLGLLMMLAQAYYKMLECAASTATWCTALDLDLNHSYLWVVQQLTSLLKNDVHLRDFPQPFAPVFPNLYPSTIGDMEWEDMVAPDAEGFLAAVQQYVCAKAYVEPEAGTPAATMLALFRPGVELAIQRAEVYAANMRRHMREILGKVEKASKPGRATSPAPDVRSGGGKDEPQAAANGEDANAAAASIDDLVTLDEAAAIVHRSKRTLERRLAQMPPPHVQGGGGKASLWMWDELRPWLEREYVPDLPERFPRNAR